MTVPILASPAPLRLASPPLAVVLILMIEGVCALLLLQHSGLLKTRAAWVVSTLLLVLGLGLRGAVFSYETLDYQNFLARWVEFFRQHGGFAALKYEIGNYNIPYLYFLALFSLLPLKDLYFIKLLSTASDLLLAWGVMLLCRRFTKKKSTPDRRLFYSVLPADGLPQQCGVGAVRQPVCGAAGAGGLVRAGRASGRIGDSGCGRVRL
jgi:hypothetical protein